MTPRILFCEGRFSLRHVAFFISALLASNSVAAITEITVGKTRFNIPSPSGFVSSTDQQFEEAKKSVNPSSELFALFVPDPANVHSHGANTESTRAFQVCITKSAIQPIFSASYFEELKAAVRAQSESAVQDKIEANPRIRQKLNAVVGDAYGIDPNGVSITISQLRPHFDQERVLAYSALVSYYRSDGAARELVSESVTTGTLVNLNGKILMLYCIAERSGLQWSQDASKEWVGALLAANPAVDGRPAGGSRPEVL